MLDAGSIEAAWRCECQWLLALVCLRASVFCVARLWASSVSGAAFLHDGVSAPCLVGLPVLERWQWWQRPAG